MVKEYSRFQGWNTQADGLGVSYYPNGSVYLDFPTFDLYAQWILDMYEIKYDANEGIGTEPGPNYVQALSSYTVLGNIGVPPLTRENYTFKNWNTLANGEGTPYQVGETIDQVTSSLVLYAQWEPVADDVFIQFNGNGATGGSPPAPSIIQSGAPFTIPSKNTLFKTNWLFTGWNTQADGSGDSYAVGQVIQAATLLLFAQWSPSYTVTYVGNGNTSGVPPRPQTVSGSVVIQPPGFMDKWCYCFLAWNDMANGSGNTYAPGQVIDLHKNTVLYAQWFRCANSSATSVVCDNCDLLRPEAFASTSRRQKRKPLNSLF